MLEPKCYTRRCKHFQGVVLLTEADESTETLVCAAFPEGIPKDISYGSNPHLEVHPQQDDENGITFEEKGKYQK